MFRKKSSSNVRKLYVIQDRVAEQYGPVFDAVNDAVALRQFRVALEKSPFLSDFLLLCIGQIDEKCVISTSGCPCVVEFNLDEFMKPFETEKFQERIEMTKEVLDEKGL